MSDPALHHLISLSCLHNNTYVSWNSPLAKSAANRSLSSPSSSSHACMHGPAESGAVKWVMSDGSCVVNSLPLPLPLSLSLSRALSNCDSVCVHNHSTIPLTSGGRTHSLPYSLPHSPTLPVALPQTAKRSLHVTGGFTVRPSDCTLSPCSVYLFGCLRKRATGDEVERGRSKPMRPGRTHEVYFHMCAKTRHEISHTAQ